MMWKTTLAYNEVGFSGGELTVKVYMEGNASIVTDMLVKAEKQEATKKHLLDLMHQG